MDLKTDNSEENEKEAASVNPTSIREAHVSIPSTVHESPPGALKDEGTHNQMTDDERPSSAGKFESNNHHPSIALPSRIERDIDRRKDVLREQGKFAEAMKQWHEWERLKEMLVSQNDPQKIDAALPSTNDARIMKPSDERSNTNDFTDDDTLKFDIKWRFLLNQLNRLVNEEGFMNPEVALVYGNLGRTLEVEGRYEEALELYEKKLELEVKIFGGFDARCQMMGHAKGSIDILLEKGKMIEAMQQWKKLEQNIDLLREQGNFPDAIEQWQECERLEKVFNVMHPQMASTYRSIAEVFQKQGKYKEAKEQLKKSLDICLQFCGPAHPKTKEIYNILQAQDKGRKGKEQLQTSYAIRNPSRYNNAPQRPKTRESEVNFRFKGNVLAAQGKFDEAIAQYRLALAAIDLKAHGPCHPSTGATYHAMGDAFTAQGQYWQAMTYYQTAHEINLKVYGPKHPSTRETHEAMGHAFEKQGKLERAMEQYQRAHEINLLANGPEHPSTGATHCVLGNAFTAQGEYMQAMEQYEMALAINLKVHGAEHPSTGATYHAMGEALYRQRKYAQAMEQYEMALAINLKAHGPEHPSTKATYRAMGNVLKRQGKCKEVTEEYETTIAISTKTDEQLHPPKTQTKVEADGGIPQSRLGKPCRILRKLLSFARISYARSFHLRKHQGKDFA